MKGEEMVRESQELWIVLHKDYSLIGIITNGVELARLTNRIIYVYISNISKTIKIAPGISVDRILDAIRLLYDLDQVVEIKGTGEIGE
jgi:hypothetical protein